MKKSWTSDDSRKMTEASRLNETNAPLSQAQLKIALEYRDVLKKTYLFLRFGIVGTVVAILLAVFFFTPDDYLVHDGQTLPSISHYYYTPARIVFTGALCAASLALLAIAGKGVQSYLLNLAALLAPLIAIIPTPVLPSEVGPAAQLANCPSTIDCIPADQLPYVATGFHIWLIISIAVIIVALGWNVWHHINKSRRVPEAFRVILALGFAVWILYFALWNVPGQDLFRQYGHVAAAGVFFILIATVTVIEAWRQWADRDDQSEPPPPAFFHRRMYSGIYLALGVIMFLDIIAGTLILTKFIRPEDWQIGNSVFIVEVVALAAFAVFWLVQTAEHFKDSNGWESLSEARRRGRALRQAR
ncbi:hypothetical protein [Cryobacterium lyxosi]|uniref:DUF998 domain-containing protein n=1 Tax=Cryobacterium lyxosi TaxID=1259228 RepID=A0A4R8ZDR6_9MICO|nr:hypothetical protein [Cryobacterium lyxosi]TFD24040.1 hypothetical protein E3T27_14825 [Cryobacterium lyxosi]